MNSSQNNTLLLLFESPKTVFTMAGIALLTGESREGVLSKRLNYYVREGKLQNPRRGIYAKKGYNPEELACLLYTPSYLSLEYVLQKAGVVFQYDSCLTCAGYLSRTVEADGKEYRYRKVKGEILAEDGKVIAQAHKLQYYSKSPLEVVLDEKGNIIGYLDEDGNDKKQVNELPDSYYRVLEIVGKYFGNNISIKRSEQGKGSFTIQFSSDEEVESFLRAIENIN